MCRVAVLALTTVVVVVQFIRRLLRSDNFSWVCRINCFYLAR